MRFKELESLHDISILVIGDIMLDTYQMGISTRISPEAPVPVVNLQQEKSMLGGAGNVLKKPNFIWRQLHYFKCSW